MKVFEAFGTDIAIIRHSDDTWIENLTSQKKFSIINAGAGKLEHPSQSLLDLFTIQQEFRNLDKNLTITICGDIINSRVAKSNMAILEKFDCNIQLCGPNEFMPKKENISKNCDIVDIDKAIKNSDVFMLLRVQHERHGLYEYDVKNYNAQFGLNKARVSKMKKGSIIMHPGPFNRGVEIESELVEHPMSRIFKQKENGVYTRMAILEWILS